MKNKMMGAVENVARQLPDGRGYVHVGDGARRRHAIASAAFAAAMIVIAGPAFAVNDGDACGIGLAYTVCTNAAGQKICRSQPAAVGGTCSGAPTRFTPTFQKMVDYLRWSHASRYDPAIHPYFDEAMNPPSVELDADLELQWLHKLGLSDEAINYLLQKDAPGLPLYPGAGRLGMYVSPAPTGVSNIGVGGGASVTHVSSMRVSDSAGLLAAGSLLPNMKDVSGGGGLYGGYDATHLFGLPAGHRVTLSGSFDYSHDDITTASVGSATLDNYRFTGRVRYDTDQFYVVGSGAYGFGHGTETQYADNSSGRFDTRDYAVDLRIGKKFLLLNTISSEPTGLPKKAPRKPTKGYIVGLDLSGHIGYADWRGDGFTDTAGFIFGPSRTKAGDVGVRAKLFAYIPDAGVLWMPYVAGTVDRQFGYSSSLTIPDQTAMPGGDVLYIEAAQTFLGAQLGLDVRARGGWTLGARGFYTASSDLNVSGGSAYLKIPFGMPPASVPANTRSAMR
jgi:hypothetical protein